MRLFRVGENSVGVHFIATHAPYLARGWIKSIRVVDGGPRSFSLLIDKKLCARTDTGEITAAHFTSDSLDFLNSGKNVQKDDPFLLTGLPIAQSEKADGYVNLTFPERITIVTDTPTDRQNYFFIQTWAQTFRIKNPADDGASFQPVGSDMDLCELPCILLFNLRSEDPTAVVHSTTPINSSEEKK